MSEIICDKLISKKGGTNEQKQDTEAESHGGELPAAFYSSTHLFLPH